MRRGTAILKELDHWENEIVRELEHNPDFENIIAGLCNISTEWILPDSRETVWIDHLSDSDVKIVKINALLRLRTIHARTY